MWYIQSSQAPLSLSSLMNSQLCVDVVIGVEVNDGFQSKAFKERIVDLVGQCRSVQTLFDKAKVHRWEKHCPAAVSRSAMRTNRGYDEWTAGRSQIQTPLPPLGRSRPPFHHVVREHLTSDSLSSG